MTDRQRLRIVMTCFTMLIVALWISPNVGALILLEGAIVLVGLIWAGVTIQVNQEKARGR